jgi:hypothetical protein
MYVISKREIIYNIAFVIDILTTMYVWYTVDSETFSLKSFFGGLNVCELHLAVDHLHVKFFRQPAKLV